MYLVDNSSLERARDINMKPIQSRLLDRVESDTYRNFANRNSWEMRRLVMRAFLLNEEMLSMIRISPSSNPYSSKPAASRS